MNKYRKQRKSTEKYLQKVKNHSAQKGIGNSLLETPNIPNEITEFREQDVKDALAKLKNGKSTNRKELLQSRQRMTAMIETIVKIAMKGV